MDEAVFHPLPAQTGSEFFDIQIAALPARMQAHPAYLLHLLPSRYKTPPDATGTQPQQPRSPLPHSGTVQASFHVPWGILFDPSGTLQARNRHGLGTVFHQYLATVILAGNTHLLQWKGLTVAFQKIAITPIVLRSIKGSEAST